MDAETLPPPLFDPPAIVAAYVPAPKWDRPTLIAQARVGYPVRGNLWTHPGRIHDHLLTGEHAGKWSADWIRGLTVLEAESLHSDNHEGRVQWEYVPKRVVKQSLTTAPAYCPPGQL